MIGAPHANSEGALSVSLAADQPAPKPHFEVCLLGSLKAPNITGPIPGEPDSETDTCFVEGFLEDALSINICQGGKGACLATERSWAARQTQQAPRPIPQGVLEPVVTPEWGKRVRCL